MRRPNVVLILADDMGYGDLGILGDGSAQTPALDQLAAEAILFTHHYSASAVCAPARAALLTGRYPHRTGAIDTLEGRGLDRLSLREVTLANLLAAGGYATGLVGKWHLGALDPRYHPNARGFQEFVGFRGGWSDYYRWRLDRNGAIQPADGRYLTDVLADEAVQFVRRHRDEPFFLHVAFNAPHFPFQAPDEDVRPFREDGKLTPRLSILYGMIRSMDRGIARILEELDRQGLREDTIVLFTSDNGPQLGGQGDECIDRFNGHFRGAKGLVFEGGIRVPALLRWPAGLGPASARSTGVIAHFCDWLPTLLALAGLKEMASNLSLDGRDLSPILAEGRPEGDVRRFWQWNRYTPIPTGNAAMRDGRWKLVRPAIREAMRVAPADLDVDRRLKYAPESVVDVTRDPEPERLIPLPPPPLLFDLDADPYEQRDLATQHPERVSRMLGELEAWFESVDADRRDVEDGRC